MDPVTIAAAISGVRTAIGAAKNIQSIGHSLDGLFKAQEEHKKKKQKAKPSTRMQQVLRMRAGDEGYDDDTSISAVANQVLEEKKTQAAIASLAKEIDRKWGRGTWNQILQQRKKLLAERAAADQLAKENALKKAKADKIFWHKVLVETGKVILVLLFTAAVIGFVMWAATAPKIR
jgi:hypothetical protein